MTILVILLGRLFLGHISPLQCVRYARDGYMTSRDDGHMQSFLLKGAIVLKRTQYAIQSAKWATNVGTIVGRYHAKTNLLIYCSMPGKTWDHTDFWFKYTPTVEIKDPTPVILSGLGPIHDDIPDIFWRIHHLGGLPI